MFEHSLIDLEAKQQPRRRRWISLPIAIALHVVGLTAFAFASYWTVGSVAEPNTNIVFVSLAPLPEMPADSSSRGPKTPETKPVQEETKPVKPQTVQPTDETVPATIPTPPTTVNVDDILTDEDASSSTGNSTFSSGTGTGDGTGNGNGTDGSGEGNGKGNSREMGVGDDSPIRVTVGMTKPEAIHQVQPRYTKTAQQAGVQGMVILEAVIDESGNVTDVRVLRGLPMGLDREAVSAVQQWKFKPALLANKPVKVYFTLTVNFTIQR